MNGINVEKKHFIWQKASSSDIGTQHILESSHQRDLDCGTSVCFVQLCSFALSLLAQFHQYSSIVYINTYHFNLHQVMLHRCDVGCRSLSSAAVYFGWITRMRKY